jgi:hypothetical protein
MLILFVDMNITGFLKIWEYFLNYLSWKMLTATLAGWFDWKVSVIRPTHDCSLDSRHPGETMMNISTFQLNFY